MHTSLRVILIFSIHITDIGECTEGTHRCAQMCTNTVGSYTCSCRTGLQLANDGQGCTGKPVFVCAVKES